MSIQLSWRYAMRAAMILLVVSSLGVAVHAQNQDEQRQAPGVSGSSPGSEGTPDSEATFRSAVRKAQKNGKRGRTYIGALIELGMFYNRHERYREGTKVLREALALVDSGVLKPSKARVPEKVIEHHDTNGTVSAEVIRQPMPYEETMEALLPAVVTAEIGANQLPAAEVHVKRLIALQGINEVTSKLNLMTAYTQYADILHRLHRDKEAAQYKRKADDINKSFKPL